MWFALRFPALFSVSSYLCALRGCNPPATAGGIDTLYMTVGLLPRTASFPSRAGRGVGGEGLSRRRSSPEAAPREGRSVNLRNERVEGISAVVTCGSDGRSVASGGRSLAADSRSVASGGQSLASGGQSLASGGQSFGADDPARSVGGSVVVGVRRASTFRRPATTESVWPLQGDGIFLIIDPWAVLTAILFHAFSVIFRPNSVSVRGSGAGSPREQLAWGAGCDPIKTLLA
jgi:hypothetical protein